MTRKRALDLGLCVLVAVALVALLLFVAANTTWFDGDRLVRWGGLSVQTAIVFGYAIRWHKQVLGRMSFWAVLLVVLTAHLAVMIYVLGRAAEWRAVWFVFLIPLESIAIGAALALTGHKAAGSG